MGNLRGTFQAQRQDIINYFGTPVVVIVKIWELILANNDDDDNDDDNDNGGILQIKTLNIYYERCII